MASRAFSLRPIFWCITGMLLLTVPRPATGEALTSREMLVRMLEALAVPEGYEGTMTAQSQTDWTGSAQVGPEYEGSYSDAWEFLRLDGRVGKESHRELATGARCTRMVQREGEARAIDLTPEHDRASQMYIWREQVESPSWAMPVLDYLDRGFPKPHELQGNPVNTFPEAELVSVDGVPCYHLRFAWGRRHVELWLDPEFNYLPRQYHLRLDYWHNVDFRNARTASRDPQRPIRERMKVPEFLEVAMSRPLTSEERLFGIVLDRADGIPFIKRASFEKTMQLGSGITHLEAVTMESEGPRPLADPERARAFLDFEGLIPNETPVTLRAEARREPEALVWRDGDAVPRHGPVAAVVTGAWRGVRDLARDFSIERIREIDTWTIVAVCAVLAIVANGVLVFSARRRSRLEQPPEVKGSE